MDALAKILNEVNFGEESDALVQTNVSGSAKSGKVEANPLTYLAGNTKGSQPSQDPPGWDKAVALDTTTKGKRASIWVRGHLLNDNLHGPGLAWNLVPITKTMNSRMEKEVEAPAKHALKEKKRMQYVAEVSFWPAPADDFPKLINVTWAKLEPKEGGKGERDKVDVRSVPIEMETEPDVSGARHVPSINGGSATWSSDGLFRQPGAAGRKPLRGQGKDAGSLVHQCKD
jgi:hypothetical protein